MNPFTAPCAVLRRLALALALAAAAATGLQAQTTYVVAVGLGHYDNGEGTLPCSQNDARDIATFYHDRGNADVFLLIDKNATRDHILRVLRNKFSQATEQDEIIFCYSGHGFDGGLSCYDTKSVIYCNEVQEIMQKSKAARKMMFLMACHSGSFKNRYNKEKGKGYNSNDRPILLYMSSRPDEYSWERTSMRNSYFYHYLLKALRGGADANGDNAVTARELFNFVNAGVQSITNDKQHPQMYGRFPDDLVIVRYD